MKRNTREGRDGSAEIRISGLPKKTQEELRNICKNLNTGRGILLRPVIVQWVNDADARLKIKPLDY